MESGLGLLSLFQEQSKSLVHRDLITHLIMAARMEIAHYWESEEGFVLKRWYDRVRQLAWPINSHSNAGLLRGDREGYFP